MTNGVMDDFQPAEYHLPSLPMFVEQFLPLIREYMPELDVIQSRQACIDQYQRLRQDEVWLNDQYQVAIDKKPRHAFPGMEIWHLSIKRLDKEPIHDWRDLQAIKDKLCGPHVEAIELYPHANRVADTANQYHLWAFISQKGQKVRKGVSNRETVVLPLGFGRGFQIGQPSANAKQREFAK